MVAITHSTHLPYITYVYKPIRLGQGVENSRVKVQLIEVGEALESKYPFFKIFINIAQTDSES